MKTANKKSLIKNYASIIFFLLITLSNYKCNTNRQESPPVKNLPIVKITPINVSEPSGLTLSFDGKYLYKRASETPAASANCLVVVPLKPCLANKGAAALKISIFLSSALKRLFTIINTMLVSTHLSVKNFTLFCFILRLSQ